LLPDLIKFAYIPQNEHRIHGDSEASGKRGSSPYLPDFRLPEPSLSALEDEEHVLVLEFAEKSRGKKSKSTASAPSNIFAKFSRAILKYLIFQTRPFRSGVYESFRLEKVDRHTE